MNDANQYMVQVGSDFDQSTFIIQDANGLPVQYESGAILQGDLSEGNNLLTDSRWIQGSGRGAKILSNQNFLNGDLVNGTGLNLNTRFTPSSIVINSSTTGTQFDQDSLRIASAVTGAGGRGRPRGRKPSRGNFPVVPIDMVRQLGIEQQVILQPTVPVAMKNKTTMCKPLLMSKKTQCNENDISGIGLSSSCTEPTIKYIHVPVFVPIPVPVYIPVPTFIRSKNIKKEIEGTQIQMEISTEALEDICIEDEQPEATTFHENKVIDAIELLSHCEEPLTIVPSETDSVTTDIAANNNFIESDRDETKNAPLKRQCSGSTDASVAKHRKVDSTISEKRAIDDCKLKYSYGINAWRHWSKNIDLLKFSVTEMNTHLEEFVQKIRKPKNEVYVPDSILYLCLGIQLFLIEHKYDLNIFVDPRMDGFQLELNKILATFEPKLSENQVLVCRIEEEHLWESQQLGAHSPGVLVFSVCYLLTKQLKLRSGEEHALLTQASLLVTEAGIEAVAAPGATPVLVCEPNNTKRCFYEILRAYIDKCAGLEGPLYLSPAPKDGPWFLPGEPLPLHRLDLMLNRIRIVKEVQESLLSASL